MIDDVCTTMTDAAVLLGRIRMTESGLYGTWRRKGGATYNCCSACRLLVFFCFPKWKRERERDRKKGNGRNSTSTSDCVSIYKYVFDMFQTVSSILGLGYTQVW
jgi:hypothetical protein